MGRLKPVFSAWILMVLALTMPAIAENNVPKLTFERVFSEPDLIGQSAGRLTFDPDGKRILFLRPSEDDVDITNLWVADVATGQATKLLDYRELVGEGAALSQAERARRERQRIRTGGIVEYAWPADRSDRLLVPIDGQLFVVDFASDGQHVRQLTDDTTFETDVKLSPDSSYASFIRDQSLFIQAADGSSGPLPMSPAGEGTISYGMAEFVAQEEMDRDTGYWWSPDGRYIAYTMVDEAPVAIVERPEIDKDGATLVRQRYPRTGTANAIVRLFVAPIASPDDYVEIDLGPDQDVYLPRVNWLADSTGLLVQRQTRDQKTLDVLLADIETGGTRTLWQERSKTWINLHHDLHVLKDASGYIWKSERDGYAHLYLLDRDGNVQAQLTKGPWQVDAIESVDAETGTVFFTGRMDSVIEKHLYKTSYAAPGQIERLTELGYWNAVKVAPDGQSFLSLRSSPTQPPQLGLYDGQGALIRWVVENPLDETHPYVPYLAAHVTPEYGTIELPDGTSLDYELYLPKGDGKVPAILDVYGGPGVQRIMRDWGSLTDQVYAQDYAYMRLDNRGAAGRGKAFEDPIYLKMGGVEVADQRRALDFLANHPRIDASRIGVKGWSYGGYMTLKLLTQAGEGFAAGVSGAPVTRWQLYDTHYTERFLGLPSGAGEDVYDKANVFGDIEGLNTPMLLIHGMADDNVLFDNATLLMAALQDRTIAFETMLYPGQKHGLRGQNIRTHAEEATERFLRRYLRP